MRNLLTNSLKASQILLIMGTFFINCHNNSKRNTLLKNPLILGNLLSSICISLDDCLNAASLNSNNGAHLMVTDAEGNLVYQKSKSNLGNDTNPNERLYVFSGSKWFTAVTLTAITEDPAYSNKFRMNATTAEILGWDPATPEGRIQLHHLLSFTSGLNSPTRDTNSEPCVRTTKADSSQEIDNCLNLIRIHGSKDEPGSNFVYNANHLAVAQAMAMKVTGKSWNSLFEKYISGPDKLDFDTKEAKYFINVRSKSKEEGSLSGAFGLKLTPLEYSRFVTTILNKGKFINPKTGKTISIISERASESILSDQLGSDVPSSEGAMEGESWRYGYGNWRTCQAPEYPNICQATLLSHSLGANGYMPWIDKNNGFAAVLAVDRSNTSLSNFRSYLIAEQINAMLKSQFSH
jgi:CubicO group peptidase (beta-lactamase class C family)